jgi:hypothetical protein
LEVVFFRDCPPYGVKGGLVRACRIIGGVMLDLVSKHAHIFRSRDKVADEIKINIVYHYMLMSYRELCGKKIIPQ